MINGENEKEINNYQNNSDLNDLFQRTYEFDIFKYVSRGLIKSQQNYETKLNELNLENLKIKKELSSLKNEIELLKGNINFPSSENNSEKDIKNSSDEIEKKKKNINNITKNDHNQGGYNNINLNKENHSNKNNKGQKIMSSDIIKDENIYSDIVGENKFVDEKDVENSNESVIKMTNTYINELVNENKIKRKKGENNYQMKINLEKFNNELINIKAKLEEIDKGFNQFKLATNQTISESNNNIKSNISDNILKLKEESKKEINSLNEGINKKIVLLNDTTKNLSEKNEENEKLMNKTNSLNNTFLGKLDILNAKFIEYVSYSDFEKFKNSFINRFEIENKEINIDISMLKKSVNTLRNEMLNFSNDTTDHENIISLKQKQEAMIGLIEKLKDMQKETNEKGKKEINIDTSKFLDIEKFDEYQKTQAKIVEKIKRENIDLGREFTEIKMVDLCNKASLKDLKNLEDNILIKMEELMNNIKEKFVEKKSMDKYLRVLEYKTKQILEEFKNELKPGKNWLLAKKPVGHLCASCETYLGEIAKIPKEKVDPWSKYVSKASGDNKSINLNVGFSKIIQMANDSEKEKEKEKYISVSLNKSNIFNGRNNSSITKKRIEDNEDLSNINMSSNTSKLNKLNLENNNSFQAEEYETDILNGSLPQIKKRSINQKIHSDRNLLKHSIKSLKHMRRIDEIGENSDFMIMMNVDQRKKNKIEFGPKITKILKKYNKSKNEDLQLNNESNKNNEG